MDDISNCIFFWQLRFTSLHDGARVTNLINRHDDGGGCSGGDDGHDDDDDDDDDDDAPTLSIIRRQTLPQPIES